MKIESKATILAVLGALLGTMPAIGQNPPKPQMAEDVFKNIKVLKGIPVSEFMETMGFFSASTLLNCADCHTAESSGDWRKYADETPRKETARKMVLMARGINQSFFGGRQLITCYSCHRGDERPRMVPDLTEMYSAPVPPEPIEIPAQVPGAPSADSLLDKYVEALGGAQKLAGMTSLAAKGIYDGSPVSLMTGQSPVELYAKAPNERTMIVHSDNGDATTATDGRAAWTAAPSNYSPFPVIPLGGTDLDAANIEAALTFPARIKQTLTDWRVGYPFTIDKTDAQVVQGMTPGKLPVILYFDSKSGLLIRMVRYTKLPVGMNPLRTDYGDYREVSGVKVPFLIKQTWVDGQATIKLSDVQLNVPIDAAKFGKPAPPVERKTP